MESCKSQIPIFQFPMNLNDQNNPEPSDEDRTVIDEMDFFADKKGGGGPTTVDKKELIDELTELDFNVNTGLHLVTGNTSDQSMVDDDMSPKSEDKRAKTELANLQADVARLNTENQRLRDMLNQVTTNYNTLQTHLMNLIQQQEDHKAEKSDHRTVDISSREDKKINGDGGLIVPRQFIDLGLASIADRGDEGSVLSKDLYEDEERENRRESISTENGGPNKVVRLSPSMNVDEQATEATMRKARVSVRARSEAPMITDGCQWRKYGQKMAKGNPCPRAYYRCTMATGCPVRKQVQRCAEDRTILITTYEGSHNHPLPPAAMAMASTTSAAAQMLLSGSMSSADGLMNSNFLARSHLPYSPSMATISASAPFPTITLDLTQNPNALQLQRPPKQFHVPFSNTHQNFSGSSAALLPQILGQALYSQSKFSRLQMSGHDVEMAQLGHQPSLPPPILNGQPSSLEDTVTAITADPNFTAALVAAIKSIIGGANPNNTTTSSNNNNGSVTTSNNTSNGIIKST